MDMLERVMRLKLPSVTQRVRWYCVQDCVAAFWGNLPETAVVEARGTPVRAQG